MAKQQPRVAGSDGIGQFELPAQIMSTVDPRSLRSEDAVGLLARDIFVQFVGHHPGGFTGEKWAQDAVRYAEAFMKVAREKGWA